MNATNIPQQAPKPQASAADKSWVLALMCSSKPGHFPPYAVLQLAHNTAAETMFFKAWVCIWQFSTCGS